MLVGLGVVSLVLAVVLPLTLNKPLTTLTQSCKINDLIKSLDSKTLKHGTINLDEYYFIFF
jgi:hypothetical protein